MINEISVICFWALLTIAMLIGFLYWVNVVACKHEMNKIVKEKDKWLNELKREWLNELKRE